ncbi:hypothetical protein RND81_02G219300 [Saponaria officinalis]|uniref:HTH myb-type domain-containing protein n=1 Tax=Saponaria officinalis TaxID=3572 RepID=A0AAW1MPE3_SAPOF
MDHQNNVENSEEMSLVLSTDAKPRLKWTPQLHHRFIDAVNQLGGPEKATPKSLMRLMGIPGLTLYHLKSHLQKYRLGKNQESENCKNLKQENNVIDSKDMSLSELNLFCEGNQVNNISEDDHIHENAHIAQAIQLQMEVQRKLHEQLEVQRHLQLRIEAQGKYLQKVLKKAHETLSIYNCPTLGVENAKAQLSQLVSMVSTSSFSELTDTRDSSLGSHLNQKHILTRTGCSVESSLTSSESSERIDHENDTAKFGQETSPLIMSLLDKNETRDLNSRMKRSRSTSTSCEGILGQEKSCKKSKQVCIDDMGLKKFGPLETFDLNSQCEIDLNLGSNNQIIDLNLKV